MLKFIKWKNISLFLKGDYPENLLPAKKLPKRYIKLTKDKVYNFTKVKEKVEVFENSIINRANLYYKGPISLLFSYEQLQYEVLKRQNQYKIFSEFLLKLKEKKKFSILYGNISKKFYNRAYKISSKHKGKINENLLILFEMRLDVLLYRICFCKTMYAAKQYVTHNFVSVNGNITNIPSFILKAGDVVSIDLSKKNKLVYNLLQHLKNTLKKRRFRFILSHKYIIKYIRGSDNLYSTLNKLKTRLKLLHNLLQKNKATAKKKNFYFYSFKREQLLSKIKKRPILSKKQRKQIFSKRQRARASILSKKFLLLEKISYLNQSIDALRKIPPHLRVDNFLLKEKILLKAKRSMRLKRSKDSLLSAMRISSMKPLHVEVSYKLLTAIVLFAPQKISFPTLLNIDLLARSCDK